MANAIRNFMERNGYTIGRSVAVHVISGVVCATAVAILLGVNPALAIAIATGVIFLVA